MFNLFAILSLINVTLIQALLIPDACLNYCSNGGICYKSDDNPKCFCLPQWTGEHCHLRQNSTVINDMTAAQSNETDDRNARCNQLNPPFCKNNGICILNGNEFTCVCPDPFIGKYCEERSECDGYCVTGDCSVVDKVPKCVCSPGWTGIRCNRRLDTPTSTTSIFCSQLGSYCNSGTCVDIDGWIRCRCPTGLTGPQCNINGTVEKCSQKTCENGGKCYPNGNSYFCHCVYGYTGRNCENSLYG